MGGKPKLYVVPASHPCAAVEKALQLKGLAYDRVDLLPIAHVAHQRVVFGKRTVPGLKLASGEKVVGSRPILRVLEGLEADPPLLPADAALRAKVEAAEEWGDEVLQPVGRRLIWAALSRATSAMPSFSEGANLPVPVKVAALSAGGVSFLERKLNGVSDDAVRADLAALPDHLNRIDAWIADGVLGAEAPNVADLQIGSGLALLSTIGDLAPLIASRPAGRLVSELFPDYPGHVPAGTLPAGWLPASV